MSVTTTQIAVHKSENVLTTCYEVEVWWPKKNRSLMQIAVTPEGLKKALVDIAEGIAEGD